MIPVRGSMWSCSDPPACAVPRKPCSGPKTATTLTFPDACMASTMWVRSDRMPVGLLITPTFWPASARQSSAARTSAPVIVFLCVTACAACPSISGAAARAPAPARRLRRFMMSPAQSVAEGVEGRQRLAGDRDVDGQLSGRLDLTVENLRERLHRYGRGAVGGKVRRCRVEVRDVV